MLPFVASAGRTRGLFIDQRFMETTNEYRHFIRRLPSIVSEPWWVRLLAVVHPAPPRGAIALAQYKGRASEIGRTLPATPRPGDTARRRSRFAHMPGTGRRTHGES